MTPPAREVRPATGQAFAWTLAGFRAVIRQGPPDREIPIPILAVTPYSSCGEGLFIECRASTILGLTIQVPYESAVSGGTIAGPVFSSVSTAIRIFESDRILLDQQVFVGFDAIHFLTVCDSANPFLRDRLRTEALCWPVLIRSDGSTVEYGQRLRPGEIVSFFAYGLGADTLNRTGVVARGPEPNETTDIDWQYGRNPLPRPLRPRLPGAARHPSLLYAGLSPGGLGLYQITVRIPEIPVEAPLCSGDIEWNVTLTMHGLSSTDGVSLCVAN